MPSIASKFKVTNKFQRFEYVDEKSSKFWEIRVAGLSVDVCFGRIGTKGSNQSKLFPGAEMARSHAEKLLLEKVGKGYVVASKSEGKPAIAPLARSPEEPGKRVVKKVPSKRPLEINLDRVLVGDYPKVLRFSDRLEAEFEKKHGPAIKEDVQADVHISNNDVVEVLHFPADAVGYDYVVIEDLANLRELHIDAEDFGYDIGLKWLICRNLPRLAKVCIRSELRWVQIENVAALEVVDLSKSNLIEHFSIKNAPSIKKILVNNCKKLRGISNIDVDEQSRLGVTKQIEKLQEKSKRNVAIYKNMTYCDIDLTLECINDALKYISSKKLYNERDERYCGGHEKDRNFRKFSIDLLVPNERVNTGGTGATYSYRLNEYTFYEGEIEFSTDSMGFSSPEACLESAVSWIESTVTETGNTTNRELQLLIEYSQAWRAKFTKQKLTSAVPPYYQSPVAATEIEPSGLESVVEVKPKAFNEIGTPSAALAVIVGSKPLTLADAMKKVFEYIEANSQRDGMNRQIIHANATLLPIFGWTTRESELHRDIRRHLK